MARGLSREQSLAKNMKKTAASNKGNQEDLSTTARAARDAAAMQEKAAAKAAAKEALAKSGDAGAAQVEAEEAQKAKLKAAAKERSLASGKAAQASKNSAGVFTAVRELTVKIVKELTAEEKLEKRQKVLAAAGMAATGVAPEKKVAAEDEDEDVEDEDEDEDDDDDDNDEAGEGGGERFSRWR